MSPIASSSSAGGLAGPHLMCSAEVVLAPLAEFCFCPRRGRKVNSNFSPPSRQAPTTATPPAQHCHQQRLPYHFPPAPQPAASIPAASQPSPRSARPGSQTLEGSGRASTYCRILPSQLRRTAFPAWLYQHPDRVPGRQLHRCHEAGPDLEPRLNQRQSAQTVGPGAPTPLKSELAAARLRRRHHQAVRTTEH